MAVLDAAIHLSAGGVGAREVPGSSPIGAKISSRASVAPHPPPIVPGLDPGTHVALTPPASETGGEMDGRVKHGHDEAGESEEVGHEPASRCADER
jgi:hypothetical protein